MIYIATAIPKIIACIDKYAIDKYHSIDERLLTPN